MTLMIRFLFKNYRHIKVKSLYTMSSVEPDMFVLDKRPFTRVTEGSAEVDFPSTQDVFYNPVQEFNRDISVAVLRLHSSDLKKIQEAKCSQKQQKLISASSYQKITEDDFKQADEKPDIVLSPGKDENGIKILEALAASGLRSIRYAKEVGGVNEIVANDISTQAVECMKDNIKKNEVDHIVTSSLNDASLLMYQHRSRNNRFHAVDLDPYGSPHVFLDAAVQSVVDGGLLLVTSTDMAVLCGSSPESCYVKYGALSMKHKACHEMAIRILLQCIEANANKYSRYIVPLLSLSVDFYCRVFVRVFTSQIKCKETFTKLSWVHQCTSCESTAFQPLGEIIRKDKSVKYHLTSPPVDKSCSFCGGTHRTAGPIWNAPLHDKAFVSRLKSSLSEYPQLGTSRRIEGILTVVEDELPNVPLYIVFDKFLKVVRMSCFKMKEFISAILNAGYKASPTHAAKNGIKTNAPYSVLWAILRAREKITTIDKEKFPENHPARVLLFNESISNGKRNDSLDDEDKSIDKISFEIHPEAVFESQKSKVLRFQQNPTECWGPKSKSVTSIFHGDMQEKSKRFQGTRKSKKLKLEDPSANKEASSK